MPIRYESGDEPCAIFEGRCVAEEADILLDWLRGSFDPSAALDTCTDLHTALVQLLLAVRPRVIRLPADALLAGLLSDLTPKVAS